MPPSALEAGQLRWRSRRGLLELELALAPFVRAHLDHLSAADRARYARLLTFDDLDLYEWLRGRAEVPDPDLRALVSAIREAAAAPRL